MRRAAGKTYLQVAVRRNRATAALLAANYGLLFTSTNGRYCWSRPAENYTGRVTYCYLHTAAQNRRTVQCG